MHTHDTTARAITLHHLRHDFTLRASGDSWTQALRNVWPDTFCAVLRNPEGSGKRHVAAYIAADGSHAYCQADSREEVVRLAREHFQAYLDAHPEEMPRRLLMTCKKRLHSEGVDMLRHEDRWNRLMDHLGRHEDARERRAAMGDFLDTVAPCLPARVRDAAIRWTEVLPKRQPAQRTWRAMLNLCRAFDMLRAQQQGVSHA